MRTKKLYSVLSFQTTTAAMEAEELSHELGLSGRIIPLPPQTSAGCGLALRLLPEEPEILMSHCDKQLWESCYELLL